ncbi:MAG: ABC transporter ATP-binding protein [Candidatus Faecousia sp.]|nr:ABC transporter ATP-binding protein [Candidatus Faecousia sp.]
MSKNAADFAAAKDIRIYGMATWLRETFSDLFRQDTAWSARLNRRLLLGRLVDLLVILLRDGGAYALLLVMAVRGELRPDEFVLYFSAISGFATFIGNMISAWNEMQTASLKVSDYRQFMELPDTDGTGTAHDTLHDISLTLRAGEHVALVGLNGAGKTTLVKLLCGLYAPTSGTIRIDGVPAAEFRRDDYAALFAPVFQEVCTACFSLAETAACAFGPEVDRERAERCLRAAGLGEKLDALPHGMDTHLDKQVNPDGIELSGGEAQKLMMARALYKDAPVLVLDEPTAALDPIAENEVYEQYRRMAAGKTSLFISHRLASTRFCDRIVLLRDGGIAEEGTHETLLAAGGEYARLYEIQSCWYQPGYQGGKQA